MLRRSIAVSALGFAVVLIPASGVSAQDTSADEAAVLATVNRLFDGMRANDGDMIRSVIADGAVFVRTEGPDGSADTSVGSLDGFADQIANAGASIDEPIWDTIVQVHDHLATVWTKYAVYVGGDFSHCGVDAFILARSDDGWKIAAISDTRESENCELPPGRN